MVLSCDFSKLLLLNDRELREAILERRKVIRWHRDQVGDDRCWLDDFLVWAMVEGSAQTPSSIPFNEGMGRCRGFYHCRRSDTKDPVPGDAILDPALWDTDLTDMDTRQLLRALARTQDSICRHRDVEKTKKRLRTIDDDRELYSALPEKIPADFRLPPEEEFLERAKAGAGCPRFWDSHSGCGRSCNLHQGGPCKE